MHKIATFILPLALLAGCASQPEAQRPTPPISPPKAAPVVRAPQPAVKTKAEPSYQAEGKASYYAARHHGRRTASGERLNNNALTAAHRAAAQDFFADGHLDGIAILDIRHTVAAFFFFNNDFQGFFIIVSFIHP